MAFHVDRKGANVWQIFFWGKATFKVDISKILPVWFDHLEESSSYKEVHFKTFCPPVKTSCSPAENVNETSRDWKEECKTPLHFNASRLILRNF